MVDDHPRTEGNRPLIERPRLVDQLAGRFEHRLTLVVGGGGSGKTSLLAQAVRSAGDDLDVVHPCTAADRDDARLLASLGAAVHRTIGRIDDDGTEPESIAAVAELVLARSPQQVCLVLDDSHRLDRGDLLAELLDELPANGHLLIAGRRRPAIDTGRLDAAGQLLELGQDDLLLTDEELVDFANLRGVDVDRLEVAERWPAFVELACTGTPAGSRRYLEEEALRGLGPERRRAVAAFAVIGGGDDEIARAVVDRPLDELVGDLPLVRWEGAEARLHDLWGELTADELTGDEQEMLTRAAAAVHRRRGRFDRAIDLARSVEAWSEVTMALGEAVIDSVDGGLQADRLRRWRTSLPAALDDDPVVGLIDGLIERERDPTSARAWDLLDRVAGRFEADDERRLALTALLQLGYLARIHGDTDRLAAVMARLTTLAERHAPARPFLAFGQAWTALATARSDLQLEAMESIAHEDLPLVWRTTRDHLLAHALVSLGRPTEGLDHVPRSIEHLPVAIPGALNTESQCLWFGGRPDEALRRRPGSLSDRYGARDLFIAGAWNAMMLAYAGDVPASRRALDVGIGHLGEAPSALVQSQTAGVEILLQIAEGDEDGAAAAVEFILDLIPLGGGVSEQMLRNNVAIPYVLAPGCRPFWDEFEAGPAQREALDIIRAFAAWRDGDPGPIGSLHWPEPGVVACQLPCRWAIELALAGLTVERHEGRRLAAWLCEHWGEPARAALRSWTDDERLGAVAREVLASTPIPPDQPASLRLLGTTSVVIGGFATDSPDLRRERVRALLALLALRPDTTRDQLAGTLWPDLDGPKAAKNLRTTLSYVHGLLEPRRGPGDAPWYVRVEGHRVRLHPSLDIDVVRFNDLLDRADDAERAGRVGAALPLLLEATESWDGDLAQDLDAEWLDLDRIHLRSRLVRAACRAAQLLVGTRDPVRGAELARLALEVDPWNEQAYLALADAYDELGDHTSARAVRTRGEEAIGAPLDPRRATRS